MIFFAINWFLWIHDSSSNRIFHLKKSHLVDILGLTYLKIADSQFSECLNRINQRKKSPYFPNFGKYGNICVLIYGLTIFRNKFAHCVNFIADYLIQKCNVASQHLLTLFISKSVSKDNSGLIIHSYTSVAINFVRTTGIGSRPVQTLMG